MVSESLIKQLRRKQTSTKTKKTRRHQNPLPNQLKRQPPRKEAVARMICESLTKQLRRKPPPIRRKHVGSKRVSQAPAQTVVKSNDNVSDSEMQVISKDEVSQSGKNIVLNIFLGYIGLYEDDTFCKFLFMLHQCGSI